MDKIIELSEGQEWNFNIGYDAENDKIFIEMDNININHDIEGYIHVFPFNDKYARNGRSNTI